MLKMNNMAKQVAWWEKELLALARFESVFQRRLASWNENDLTFFHTSIADMGERLREHEQALVTAVFESTKQLLNELVCQMRAYRSRLMNRLLVITQMEPSLLETTPQTVKVITVHSRSGRRLHPTLNH